MHGYVLNLLYLYCVHLCITSLLCSIATYIHTCTYTHVHTHMYNCKCLCIDIPSCYIMSCSGGSGQNWRTNCEICGWSKWNLGVLSRRLCIPFGCTEGPTWMVCEMCNVSSLGGGVVGLLYTCCWSYVVHSRVEWVTLTNSSMSLSSTYLCQCTYAVQRLVSAVWKGARTERSTQIRSWNSPCVVWSVIKSWNAVLRCQKILALPKM